DVGTTRLLAHGVEALSAHELLETEIIRTARRSDLQPPGLACIYRDRLALEDGQPRRALRLDDAGVLAFRRIASNRRAFRAHGRTSVPRPPTGRRQLRDGAVGAPVTAWVLGKKHMKILTVAMRGNDGRFPRRRASPRLSSPARARGGARPPARRARNGT